MGDKEKLKNVTASREMVKCDFCGKDFERRHLKAHTERVHKGEKPTIRPASDQRTLQFSLKGLKRKSGEGNNNNDGAKASKTVEVAETNDESENTVEEEPRIEESPPTVDDIVTNEHILEEVKKSTEVLLECI